MYSVKHPIVEHFWRIEFQNRGFPHIHCLLWVQNAPIYKNAVHYNAIPNFLVRNVSTEIPGPVANEALRRRVLTLQVHTLTATCKKYDRKIPQVHEGLISFTHHLNQLN